MAELLLTIGVGAAVMLLGAWQMRRHAATWRDLRVAPDVEPTEREQARRQYARRMQTSGLIVFLGLLLCLGTKQIPWQRNGVAFSLYLALMLFVVLWIFALAVADMASIRLHSAVQLARIHGRQLQLQEELRRIRETPRPPPVDPRANGHHH
jgi:hypothetical protein